MAVLMFAAIEVGSYELEMKIYEIGGKNGINEIDRIIFDELCKGEIKNISREYYKNVIRQMIEEDGIEGVVLGCTEIEMLIKESDLDIPIFDTTQSHIDSIVDYSLEKKLIKK